MADNPSLAGDMLKLVKPWHVGPSRLIARTRVFSLKERWCASPDDPTRAGMYVYLDAADWCNVVALTPERKVVMIEQFRAGIAEVTLELAGGIVDAGEAPAGAGERELREETGYTGVSRGVIGIVSANPAILNNRVHTILITDCRPTHGQALDGNEQIATRLVALEELAGLVRRGVIHHALVVSALHHYAVMGTPR